MDISIHSRISKVHRRVAFVDVSGAEADEWAISDYSETVAFGLIRNDFGYFPYGLVKVVVDFCNSTRETVNFFNRSNGR